MEHFGAAVINASPPLSDAMGLVHVLMGVMKWTAVSFWQLPASVPNSCGCISTSIFIISTASCQSGAFRCSNECIVSSGRCDRIQDCMDGSDETGCSKLLWFIWLSAHTLYTMDWKTMLFISYKECATARGTSTKDNIRIMHCIPCESRCVNNSATFLDFILLAKLSGIKPARTTFPVCNGRI